MERWLKSRMPPGGNDLLRRLLEESVQRLNEKGKCRREAEERENANKFMRKRTGIIEKSEKNQKFPQYHAEEEDKIESNLLNDCASDPRKTFRVNG